MSISSVVNAHGSNVHLLSLKMVFYITRLKTNKKKSVNISLLTSISS